ncbi:hypothetical protein SAMN04244572_02361 [Azotobacter beijerinckii]|uniref:Uncharacterized protein n=1 Tax=Azotobacter beijerinckii TaxID=170623 RepID=A0A1H6V3T7_9GAMM|nr:hypothetical protein [Azotobacter beijerinckii]SEI99289.1 hypothetical protein SAMN04244572_02361 [Azotobacter beijerinckii]
MHTTATLHAHPACASKRRLIEQLQADTKRLVVIHGGKPRLVSRAKVAVPASEHTVSGGAAR